jgi:hypothetical protein
MIGMNVIREKERNTMGYGSNNGAKRIHTEEYCSGEIPKFLT